MFNWNLDLSSRQFIALGLIGVLAVLVGSSLLNFYWHELVFLISFALIVLLLFLKPWWGFLALLLVRPGIDIYGGRSLAHWGFFDLSFNILLGIIVFIWGVIFCIEKHDFVKKDPRYLFIFLFLVLSGASIFYGIADLSSLREFIRIGGIFLLSFVGFIFVKDRKRLKILGAVILASLVVPVAFACVQYFSGTGQSVAGHGFLRVYGTLAHPNSLAFLLVTGFAVLVSFYPGSESKNKKLGFCGVAFFIFLMLLATYTRGAWLGFGIFALIFGFFYARGLLAALAIAGGVVFLVSPFLRERIFDLIRPDLWGSIMWRWDLWKEMLGFWRQRPLFGYGLGAFEILAERLYGFYTWSYEAHNDYLRLGVELGTLGLVIYVMIYVKTIIVVLRGLFRTKRKELKPFFLGGAGLFIAFLIVSFGDNILRGTALQWALWSWGGGLLSLAVKKN